MTEQDPVWTDISELGSSSWSPITPPPSSPDQWQNLATEADTLRDNLLAFGEAPFASAIERSSDGPESEFWEDVAV